MLFLGTLLCLGIVQTFSAVNVFLLRNGTLEIFSEGKRSSFGIFDARAQQVVETMVDEFSDIGVAAPNLERWVKPSLPPLGGSFLRLPSALGGLREQGEHRDVVSR